MEIAGDLLGVLKWILLDLGAKVSQRTDLNASGACSLTPASTQYLVKLV